LQADHSRVRITNARKVLFKIATVNDLSATIIPHQIDLNNQAYKFLIKGTDVKFLSQRKLK